MSRLFSTISDTAPYFEKTTHVTPIKDAIELAALGVFNIFHDGIRARHLWVTVGLIIFFRRLARDHAVEAAAVAPPPAPPPRGVPSFAKRPTIV